MACVAGRRFAWIVPTRALVGVGSEAEKRKKGAEKDNRGVSVPVARGDIQS